MKGIAQTLKKQSPLILSIVGSIGVLGTAVLTTHATIKAVRIADGMQRLEPDKGKVVYPSNEEIVKAVWKCYIPPVTVGLATIGCILGSAVLSRHQQKALASAYILLDQSFREYKNKVNELYGENADREVRSEIVKDLYADTDERYDGETLIFYEEHYGKLFERTMLQVKTAEYELNRKFALDGEASINDFLDLLGLDNVDFGDCIGWLADSNYDFYGHLWIEFKHEPIIMDDGMECKVINITTPPSVYY